MLKAVVVGGIIVVGVVIVPLIAAAALTAAASSRMVGPRIAGPGHNPAVHIGPHRHTIDPNDPRLKTGRGMI
jgi:hypothetical protein